MKVSIVEETENEPVSLEEMKAWLKLEIDDDDSVITSLITASRQHCENELNKSLVSQTLLATFDGFSVVLDLPFPPIESIEEVLYFDVDGEEQELEADSYWFSKGIPARIEAKERFPATQSRPDSVSVEYITAGDCTENIKTAIRMLVAHWYTHRAAAEDRTVSEVPLAVKTILQNERNFRL